MLLFDIVNGMIENVIGMFELLMVVVGYFWINDWDVIVLMVVEELLIVVVVLYMVKLLCVVGGFCMLSSGLLMCV